MSDFTDDQIARAMRKLAGEICTLSSQRAIVDEIKKRGLMKFVEWPSGHWTITQMGRNFLDINGIEV